MNEQGIARIASMLLPFVNDPNRFGNIREDEVRAMTVQIMDDITEEIGLYWRHYGIRKASNKDIIIDALGTLIFITLTRSAEGGEKRFLSSIILESVGNQQKKKKESAFDKWLKI